MTPRGRVFTTVLVGALTLGAWQPASGGETNDYPTWWSPELELDSLDRAEEALNAAFPWRQQFHLYKNDFEVSYLNQVYDEHRPEMGYNYVFRDTNLRDRLVTDCASLMKSVRDGYSSDSREGFNFYSHWSAHCYALDALTTVRPARTSHLRDFAFDGDAKKYLPAMVGEGWDCRVGNQLLKANRDGTPWADFEFDWVPEDTATYELIVKSANEIVEVQRLPEIDNLIYSRQRVTIYGRGDFSGDGLDDLLVRSERDDPYTRTTDSALYIITRFEPNAVLRVVGARGPMPWETHTRCPLQPSDFPTGAD